MNKLAADAGLVKAAEQRGFREENTVLLKKGAEVKKPPPVLPSDVEPGFVYGKPGTHRSVTNREVVTLSTNRALNLTVARFFVKEIWHS
jgi:hypothetical protein